MQSEQSKLWQERINTAASQAVYELEQLAKDAERMAEETRLFGKRQRRAQSKLYAAVSGQRVQPVKGFDASANKAERKKAKRAKAYAKQAKTRHTQNKAPGNSV